METDNQFIISILLTAKNDAKDALLAAQAQVTSLADSMSLAAVGIGLASASIILSSTKAAVKFQQDMELIHTQAGVPQAAIEGLSRSVIQLSQSAVGFSPDTLAEGLYHISSAGYQGAQSLDMLKTSAELARVGLANIETTSNAVIGVMVSQVKGVKDAADAAANLNAIVGTGNVRMQDLASSIGTGVLPTFHTAGLSIRDFGAAMATSTDNAIPAEVAATRLRMTIAQMVSPSNTAVTALQSVGISQHQLADDLRQPNGLMVAIKDLSDHLVTSGLTATEQAAVINDAFGKSRSSSEINLLIDEQSRLSSKYKQIGQDVTKWSGDVAAAEDTVAARWDAAKASASAFAVVIGSALLPAFSGALMVLTPIEHAITGIIDALGPVPQYVMLAVGALAALKAVMIGGQVATRAYEFGLRNVLPVISHQGAVINSYRNVLVAQAKAEEDAATATAKAALAEEAKALATKKSEADVAVLGARISVLSAQQAQYAANVEYAAAKEKMAAITKNELADDSMKAAAASDLETAALNKKSAAADLAAARDAAVAARKAALTVQEQANTVATQQNTAATQTAAAVSSEAALAAEKLAAENALAAIAAQQVAAEQEFENAELALHLATTNADSTALEINTAQHNYHASAVKLEAVEEQLLAAETALNTIATNDETAAVTLDAVAKDEDAAATGVLALAEGALTVATSLLVAVFGSLELGIGVVIAAIGILAYEHIPAVHDAVNGVVKAVGVDMTQAFRDAGSAARWASDGVGGFIHNVLVATGDANDFNQTMSKGSWKDTLGESIKNALGESSPLAGQLLFINDLLHAQAAAHAAAAAAAAKHAAAVRDAAAAEGIYRSELTVGGMALRGYGDHLRLVAQGENEFAAFQAIAAAALQTTDAALAATSSKLTAFSDNAVAQAKRMSDGVIAEVHKMTAALGAPMAEMRLTDTPNAPIAGESTQNLTRTSSATVALSLAPEAQAALNAFNATVNTLPQEYRAVFAAGSDDYKAKVMDAYNAFVVKFNDENKRHEDAIRTLNTTEEQKVAADRQRAQAALNAENQRYVQAIAALNQTHENALQSILQNFTIQFQTVLQNYQAAAQSLQERAQAEDSAHQGALQALQASEQAKMQKIQDEGAKKGKEWLDQQRTILLQAYERAVNNENARFSHSMQLIQTQGATLSDAFNRRVNEMDAHLKENTARTQAAYNVALQRLNEAHMRHETAIEEKLKQNVASLHSTLEAAIAKENAGHDRHVTALREALDGHITKLGVTLNKNMTPGDMLSKIDSGTQKEYKDALEKATVDILLHGSATRQDIAALQTAASERDKFTAAQAKAEVESHTALSAHRSATDQLTAMTNAARHVTDDAMAKLVVAITTHTGHVKEDTAAVLKAATAMGHLDGVIEKVKAIADSVKPATYSEVQSAMKGSEDARISIIAENTNVIKERAAIVTDGIKAQTQAIDAQTAIITAQGALSTAAAQGQVKGIEDQTAVAHALYEVANATSPQGLAIAQAQLQLAQDKYAFDQQEAAMRVQIATDEVKAATDKAAVDAANTAALHQVAQDALAVDLLKVQLAKDRAKLAEDQLHVLVNINAALKGATTGQQTIAADEAKIRGDDRAIDYAVRVQTKDEDAAAKIAAEGANTLALDNQKKAIDTQGLATIQNTAAVKEATDASKIQSVQDTNKISATLSEVLSAQSRIDNAEIKLVDANTTVIKENSSIQVQQLNDIATRIADQTAIMSAQENVSKASADGIVKSIQDQAAIAKDQTAIATAKTSADRAVATAQLNLEMDKLRFDQGAAGMAIAVAQQQLKAAQDKAQRDIEAEAFAMKVAQDQMNVDQLKVALARDELRLAQDQLSILNDIDQALGGATDNQKLINEDNQQIQKDNASIAQAMQQLAIDEAAKAAQDAQFKVQEAQNASQAEMEKAAQAQYDQIAAIREAQDQAAIDAAQNAKAISDAGAATVQAINDRNNELRQDLLKLIGIEERGLAGLGRLDVTDGHGPSNMMNGWASDAARSAGAPG
ncbi:MAG: hypothetical protein LC754_10355 [Acidobacteria bacterium]|nr:hypothetical protein [Acidobacteriota bacterium]